MQETLSSAAGRIMSDAESKMKLADYAAWTIVLLLFVILGWNIGGIIL